MAAPKGKSNGLRILIVDDEAELRAALARELAARGYTTHEAEGAFSAIEILKTTTVDVIVSDVRMPKGNANDLLNWINREESTENRTPVILMSGQSEVIEYMACQLGVTTFLMKPLSIEMVLDAIEQCLATPLKKAN